MPATATGTGAIPDPEPRILSASWGTDNAVGCPKGEQGLAGRTFVRVMWSNGLTAHPSGEEVGAPVASSALPGC